MPSRLTKAQNALFNRIRSRGGAIQRRHLSGHEIAVAWRLVEKGELIVDGAATASHGPYNQASRDTLTFVLAEPAALTAGGGDADH